MAGIGENLKRMAGAQKRLEGAVQDVVSAAIEAGGAKGGAAGQLKKSLAGAVQDVVAAAIEAGGGKGGDGGKGGAWGLPGAGGFSFDSLFPRAAASALSETENFGANPGNLRLLAHVPEGLAAEAPLVVALHGCTQTAADYDHGSGWSALAERHRFALLMPEQRQQNNPNRCFNWFVPEHMGRGEGEPASIVAMIAHMLRAHGLDRRRIFVVGLSAGGAMANVVLATYPEVFAGGAVIAGLPYGGANKLGEAIEAMGQGRRRQPAEWGDLVRAASRHKGPWPRLSVWHGNADVIVNPVNAENVVEQWLNVHGLGGRPASDASSGAAQRRVWHDAAGRPVIESVTVQGLPHGVPIGAIGSADMVGNAGPYHFPTGLPSSTRIVEFWGLG